MFFKDTKPNRNKCVGDLTCLDVREAMAKATPSKKNTSSEQEINNLRAEVSALREELKKKSDVIR